MSRARPRPNSISSSSGLDRERRALLLYMLHQRYVGCARHAPHLDAVPLRDAVAATLAAHGDSAPSDLGALDALVAQLTPACPECRAPLTAGDLVAPTASTPGATAVLSVVTVDDAKPDFERLFELRRAVPPGAAVVRFEFGRCKFLHQNGVAFLGGLATSLERAGQIPMFDWETIRASVRHTRGHARSRRVSPPRDIPGSCGSAQGVS